MYRGGIGAEEFMVCKRFEYGYTLTVGEEEKSNQRADFQKADGRCESVSAAEEDGLGA